MATTLFDTDNVGLGGDPHAHRSRQTYKGDWYSGKGYDLHVPPGTSVYSLTDGKIEANNKNEPKCKKGVYGNRVTIRTNDGDRLYYTHIDSDLIPNKTIKKGDLVGKITKDCPNIDPHLHIASENRDVRNYVKNFKTWEIVGGGSLTNTDQNKEKDEKPEDPEETKLDPITKAYYRAVTGPMIAAALPGLAQESRLIEQINRIKNLM